MRRNLLVLVLAFAGFFFSSQSSVLGRYPAAVCVKNGLDTKYKIIPTPTSMTPIGYGITEAAAWDDAAKHL